eukprot:5512836-Prymnesium_polylepis.1
MATWGFDVVRTVPNGTAHVDVESLPAVPSPAPEPSSRAAARLPMALQPAATVDGGRRAMRPVASDAPMAWRDAKRLAWHKKRLGVGAG